MKFYIAATGIKRVTISSAVAGEGSGGGGNGGGGGGFWQVIKGKGTPVRRRLSHRAVLPAAVVLGIILSFLFVRIAFIVLESATICSSSLECMGWRLFSGVDSFPVSVYNLNLPYSFCIYVL
ncbi:hypothetical protein U1Q18_024785 [Sarracenia purpurea var. burkii]